MSAKLFDRSSRRVRLTPIGQQLQERIAPLVAQIQDAYAEVAELTNGVVGTLRLGIQAHAFAGLVRMVEIVKVFESRHPRCLVRVTDIGTSPDPFDWLRRDEVDVILARLPIDEPDLLVGPIVSTEPRVLAVASNHPLAGRSSVSVEDLVDYSTTDTDLMPRALIDAHSPPRTPSGRTIRRTKVMSVVETALRVATGELVHPTVPSFFTRFSHFGLVGVPITDLPASNCALISLRANSTPRVQAFALAAADSGEPGKTDAMPTESARAFLASRQ